MENLKGNLKETLKEIYKETSMETSNETKRSLKGISKESDNDILEWDLGPHFPAMLSVLFPFFSFLFLSFEAP